MNGTLGLGTAHQVVGRGGVWLCVLIAMTSLYFTGVYKSMGVANKGLVFAVFTHHPECSEELGCEEGDILRVLERGGGLRGKQWWLAECGGLEGLVPCMHLGVSDRYRVAL